MLLMLIVGELRRLALQLTPGGTLEDRQLRNFVQMLCEHQIDRHKFSPFYHPQIRPCHWGLEADCELKKNLFSGSALINSLEARF